HQLLAFLGRGPARQDAQVHLLRHTVEVGQLVQAVGEVAGARGQPPAQQRTVGEEQRLVQRRLELLRCPWLGGEGGDQPRYLARQPCVQRRLVRLLAEPRSLNVGEARRLGQAVRQRLWRQRLQSCHRQAIRGRLRGARRWRVAALIGL